MPNMNSTNRLSRRQLLRYSAGALLAASVWPGALAAGDPAAEGFRFFAINDLHFNDDACVPFFTDLVKQLNATPSVDLCLLVGDLTDKGTPEQETNIREIFNALKMPVHVVIGNHDYRTSVNRAAFEDAWPKSLNYTFDHKGWQFLGIDTSEGTKADVTCGKPTLDYLDETMPKIDRNRPLALFTHFPHGPLTPYRVRNADAVLERFRDHNLRAVLNGHYHGSTERKMGQIVLTTNKCCSRFRSNHDKTPQKGYFLCTAKDGQITREFVEFRWAGPNSASTTMPT